MTNWKDLLPEHEPEKVSWKKLEDSLGFEEQLHRELPNLPGYEPDENCWQRIDDRLAGQTRRPMGQYALWRFAAAAAVLILIVSGVLFLRKEATRQPDPSGPNPSRQLSQNERRPVSPARTETGKQNSGNRATENMLQDVPPGTPEAEFSTAGQMKDARQPALNTTDVIADARKPALPEHAPVSHDVLPESRKKSNSPVGGFAVDSSYTALVRRSPAAPDTAPAGNTGHPLSATSSSAAEETAEGHHRVIRVQWKTPERSRVILARQPAEAPRDMKSNIDHLIKIKL